MVGGLEGLVGPGVQGLGAGVERCTGMAHIERLNSGYNNAQRYVINKTYLFIRNKSAEANIQKATCRLYGP